MLRVSVVEEVVGWETWVVVSDIMFSDFLLQNIDILCCFVLYNIYADNASSVFRKWA